VRWLLVPLAFLVACSRTGPRWPERPHIVLVSLDTVRADRLGAYGYPRPTTPSLDAFAADAVRFEAAFTPFPWTLLAHMSLLTGLSPSVHGVTPKTTLSPASPTLARTLGTQGYTTLAVVEDMNWMSPDRGFEQGFRTYEAIRGQPARKVDRALELVDSHPDTPLFLLVHFFAAHSDPVKLPYEAEPADQRVLARATGSRFEGCLPRKGCATEALISLNEAGERLPSVDEARLSDLYDAGLRSLDREVGRLLEGLRGRGLFDETVIFVLSDHGEELGEHGRYLHEQLYDEVSRVPLMVRTPSTQPSTSHALVSLEDIAPTVHALLGLPPPDGTLGRDLTPVLAGGDLDAPVFFDGMFGVQGVRSRSASLVNFESTWRTHDLGADPAQQAPVATPPPSLVAAMEARRVRLAELRPRFAPAGAAVPLDEDEAERLQALGYLRETTQH